MFEWQNVIYDVGLILTTILTFGFSYFSYSHNRKSKENILMSIIFLLIATISTSQFIGIGVSDPALSKYFLLASILFIWVGVLLIHTIRSYIGKNSRNIMYFLYTFVGVFTLFFIFKPDIYLLNSAPLLYFNNFYNPGILNIFEPVFVLALCLPYTIFLLESSAKKEKDLIKKKYFRYFIYTISGYALITHIPFLLSYGIDINPLYATLAGALFTLFVAYKIEKNEFISIKNITRQTLLYTISVTLFSILITALYYGVNLVKDIYPDFPIWAFPIVFALVSVTILIFIWSYLHRGEVMKGEFMSVVTHKLRAPLTHIRWASENLSKSNLNKDDKEQVSFIRSANEKLLELTDLLVNISNTENTKYLYNFEKTNLTSLAKEIVDTVFSQLDNKKVRLVTHYTDMLPVNIDMSRIRFVMQTFLENAIHYTPQDAEIEVYCYRDDKYAVFSVRDNGIGISKEEVPMLFKKFYRGKQAKASDSEGMGIALFMSREILDKHKGKIWAESKGLNMGSTFNISIPITHS